MKDAEFKQSQDVVKNELSELYLRMFKQFHKLCTLELPEEMSALSAAYGLDQEAIFIEVVERHLETIKLPRRGLNGS